MTPQQTTAIDEFVARVRRHYGERIYDVVLFGSRARGDWTPESDADVAVILVDGDWRFWGEKMVLADMTYEALMDAELVIQAWPIPYSAWEMPSTHHNRRLVEAIKRDGRKWPLAA